MAEPRRRMQERTLGTATGRGLADPRNVLPQLAYEYRGRDTEPEPDPAVIAAAVRAEARRRIEQREAGEVHRG